MPAEEIHSLYDTILILDFGSQVGASLLVGSRCLADDRIVLALDHEEMS
jgi:hypothetical protein